MKAGECQYEVLNPWAEADPIPLRGISPGVSNLADKTIGLYSSTYKMAARPISDVVAQKLKGGFPTAKFSWFDFGNNLEVTESKERSKFEEWVKGVDVVVAAVGD